MIARRYEIRSSCGGICRQIYGAVSVHYALEINESFGARWSFKLHLKFKVQLEILAPKLTTIWWC